MIPSDLLLTCGLEPSLLAIFQFWMYFMVFVRLNFLILAEDSLVVHVIFSQIKGVIQLEKL